MKAIFINCIISVFYFIPGSYAQIISQDSIRFQYDKIYASCLDGDVQSALLLLAIDTVTKISVTDRTFKSINIAHIKEKLSTVLLLLFLMMHSKSFSQQTA